MLNQIFSEQKYLEKIRRGESKVNLFISGIPNELNMDLSDLADDGVGDDAKVKDPARIIQHVLEFVNPEIEPDNYEILVNFDPAKEGYSRHSAKIRVKDMDVKSKIFRGCKKFKDLHEENYLKKIFIKNDDPPLTRQENDRLRTKLIELKKSDLTSQNKYTIQKGKLLKNGEEVLDEFNISNQLFQ